MSDTSLTDAGRKVEKPYPEYPLTPHRGARQWCKKIKGKIYYFGPLADPQAALDRYLHDRDYLLAGRTPPPIGTLDGVTIQDIVNKFLTSKLRLMESGELQRRSFKDYYDVCEVQVGYFGTDRVVESLTPQDFAGLRKKLAEGKSLITLKNRITRLKVLFRWTVDNGLVGKICMGTEFRPPSAKALRLEKSKKPPRLLSREEICKILNEAPTIHVKAMALLGINCGLGNYDVSEMQEGHVDLDAGWLKYPRVKTGIDRKCKLWPETVQALREVLAKRRKPKDPADSKILFLTKKCRQRYITCTGDLAAGKARLKDNITGEFSKFLRSLGIDRPGIGFYSLRHTFRTMADNLVGDQRAIDMVMGHKRGDISETYTHKVDDQRLEKVAAAVHDWLFPRKQEPESEAPHEPARQSEPT